MKKQIKKQLKLIEIQKQSQKQLKLIEIKKLIQKQLQEFIFSASVCNSILLDNTKQRSLQSCYRALGLNAQQATNKDPIVL